MFVFLWWLFFLIFVFNGVAIQVFMFIFPMSVFLEVCIWWWLLDIIFSDVCFPENCVSRYLFFPMSVFLEVCIWWWLLGIIFSDVCFPENCVARYLFCCDDCFFLMFVFNVFSSDVCFCRCVFVQMFVSVAVCFYKCLFLLMFVFTNVCFYWLSIFLLSAKAVKTCSMWNS